MKILGLVLAGMVSLAYNPLLSLAESSSVAAQPTVKINTDPDGAQVQFTRVSIDRVDLNQPHILRVRGSINQTAIPMARVEVKLNGKVIKSIRDSSLDVDLAPMMTTGHYEVVVSGTTTQTDATISLNFSGKNTQVNQQSSGSGEIEQRLVIDVR